MDPLSIAAGVVGVVVPALQCVQRLVDDLKKITDAPETIATLRGDVLVISQTLASFQAVPAAQWETLGESVAIQARSAITSCSASCERFQLTLGRWTRGSPDGRLLWQGRIAVGVFQQGLIRSISEQLQNCKTTLSLVASTATLYGYLQQAKVSEEIIRLLSAREAEMVDAMATTDQQLGTVHSRLEALRLAGTARDETDADWAATVAQVEAELSTLSTTNRLLQELLVKTQTTASRARGGHDRVVNHFGAHNEGMQLGVSYGSISGLTFGKK
ncbi:hypothetical protein NKR23_g2027 [Pleurostoma richardsiae]|uniref:Azaphilone pigments biosynthesis cluster protein L N-terminal domain-containing protein n=1 Tax=Pleurostoma richardsiae TaxID=41990 RepID=A0AA38S3U3_9PEZI|nr:hypothetical protein NKR23_g2027 [Pleurostoma richardsiae]